MAFLAAAYAALAFAAPTATDYPTAIADVIQHDRGTITAASYLARPGGATTAVGGPASATAQPLDGDTMAYLSTGDATVGWSGAQADNISHDRNTTFRGGNDVIVLSLRVNVPEEANCLTLGASFFSEDYGSSVTDDPRYFDSFLAELDPADPWSAGDGDPSTLSAPANFAKVVMPDGPKPVSALVHSLSFSTQQAYGTAYDGTTQWHTFKVPVTPGPHVLVLSSFDRADGAYDSTTLVDNLRLIRRRPETCTFPGRDQFSSGEDLDAPAVTIAESRGRLSGTAGTGPNDADRVTVRVGPETFFADVVDGRWSLTPSGLDGSYTARASQVDAAGNEGRSGTATVTVVAPPDPEPTPEPTTEPEPEPTATASPSPTPGASRPTAPTRDGSPSGASPAAPAPFASAPPLIATARCKVPKLRGKTRKAAVRALRRAGCRLGSVSRKRAHKGKRGRAIAQTPKAGARRPAGTRVKVTLRR